MTPNIPVPRDGNATPGDLPMTPPGAGSSNESGGGMVPGEIPGQPSVAAKAVSDSGPRVPRSGHETPRRSHSHLESPAHSAPSHCEGHRASQDHDAGGSFTHDQRGPGGGTVPSSSPLEPTRAGPSLGDGTCDDGCYYGRKSQRDSAAICFWVVVIGFALAVVAWVWCGMPLG